MEYIKIRDAVKPLVNESLGSVSKTPLEAAAIIQLVKPIMVGNFSSLSMLTQSFLTLACLSFQPPTPQPVDKLNKCLS